MYVFIYLLFKVFTQSSLHHNHIFSWRLFFLSSRQKKNVEKRSTQLSLSSKIDDILEYWLYFDLKRGNFAIFTGRKCFWSVRCSDVSESYCNFICPLQVSLRIKENESHLLTAAWKWFTISISVANRSFSHDVAAAIFVYKKNPLGIELFSHV